jgi:coenzyme F420-dependent glucose-6-phosphate dehydrogenase
LLDFACLAEGRLRIGVRQRSLPAVEAYRRSRAQLDRVAGRARRPHLAVVSGTSVLTPTFRYHPSIVAQAFGTLGSMFPGG